MKPRRRQTPALTRFNVWRRDGFRCTRCSASAFQAGVVLEVDHIVPTCDGGSDEIENLATLCKRCHVLKSGPERGKPVFAPPAEFGPMPYARKGTPVTLTRHPERAAIRDRARRILRTLASNGPEFFTLNDAQRAGGDLWQSYKAAEFLRDHGFFDLVWRQNRRLLWWQLSDQAIRWLDIAGFDWAARRAS